jgi:DNA polymerase-4
VVTTANYEARRFGIDSAMPAARARALCPQAIFLTPDFAAYRAKSHDVWEIVRSRFATVGQVGIDEAYIDLSSIPRPLPLLRELVGELRSQTGMTISVGVGPSRLVAKTASASFKPEAFVAMGREQAVSHFAGHPVRLLQGIGPKTAERLAAALHARAHFHDDTPVEVVRVAKSRSSELTFPTDVSDPQRLEEVLVQLARELGDGLRIQARRARTVAVKVRLDDWTTVTRARTLERSTNESETIATIALALLRAYAPPRPVRLLGVRVAAFEDSLAGGRADAPGRQLALPI